MFVAPQVRRIAKALFELAQEVNHVSAWASILLDLKTVIQLDFLQAVLSDRRIDSEQWLSFFLALKIGHLQALETEVVPTNLLRQLAEKQQLGLLPAIADEFERLRRKAAKEECFTVLSSTPLTPAFQASIEVYLAQRFQCKPKLRFQEDPSLVGGVKIQGEGWTLDYSIQGQLTELREQLV